MPPRPSQQLRQNRPSSAIYLGNNNDLSQTLAAYASSHSIQPDIPDLPEPPSPITSIGSTDSGLPSPPATNSTGSGSTGDPGTAPSRKRPISLHSHSSSSSGGGPGGVAGDGGGVGNLFSPTPGALHHSTAALKAIHRLSSSSGGSRYTRNSGGDEADDDDFDDVDDHNDNDNEEDNTARLERRQSSKPASENVLALQRVKSLTQRNRMVLDKLSSFSRLNTPSPSQNSNPRSNRSPIPPPSQASSHSSSSSSKLSQPQPRHVLRPLPTPPEHLSGSETEREETMHSSSSHLRPSSSLQVHSPAEQRAKPSTPPLTSRLHTRSRLVSAPASPNRTRLVPLTQSTSSSSTSSSMNNSNGSNSPTSRRRKRASMASMTSSSSLAEDLDDDDQGLETERESTRRYPAADHRDRVDDITQSALAAVASSRRSPVGSRKTRGALPREFRESAPTENRRGSLDGSSSSRNGRFSAEPPIRNGGYDPTTTTNTAARFSPVRQLGQSRSSTVRELGRRATTHVSGSRWGSDDLGRTTTPSGTSLLDREERRERRQSLRGGSAESALALAGGRSLVSEGLRAAGLRRRDEGSVRGESSRGVDAHSAEPASATRERRVEWGASPDVSRREERERSRSRISNVGTTPRAATSMADYRYTDGGREDEQRLYDEEDDDRGPRTAPLLRGTRSSYALPRAEELRSADRDRGRELSLVRRERAGIGETRTGSALSRHTHALSHPPPSQAVERHSSPFGTTRRATAPLPPSGAANSGQQQQQQQQQQEQQRQQQEQQATEHARLMFESLSMFENHLGRVPQLSHGPGGGTQTDLVRSAQGIAHAAEKLNILLRHGTARALEEQIDAEVDGLDEAKLVEMWRTVGGDYREGLRISDELVRSITGFLLGVGRVVRDFGGGGYSGGDHNRSASEDVVGMRRTLASSPDVGDGGSASGSGRKSVESRRSWEPREGGREDALRRLSSRVDSPRPGSSFGLLRDRGLDTRHESSPLSVAPQTPLVAPIPTTGSMRRLFTPREQREIREQQSQQEQNAESTRQSYISSAVADRRETLYDYEPSPTPASRSTRMTALERTNGVGTPGVLPKPLPSLPSETISRRTSTPINTSPLITSTSTMTASTIASRERERRKISVTSVSTVRPTGSFPSLTTPTATTPATPLLTRGDSQKSARTNVTFSRPAGGGSVSTLSGLHQQALQADSQIRRADSQESTATAATTTTTTSSSSSASSLALLVSPSVSSLSLSSVDSVPRTPQSGSETERDQRRMPMTVGMRGGRTSLDGVYGNGGGGGNTNTVGPSGRQLAMGGGGGGTARAAHAADRHAAATFGAQQNGNGARPRRKTITDLWPR